MGMKTLIIVHSYHHGNTRKIAEAMAEALGATVKAPRDIAAAELEPYDLIGFGSGIDSDRHYAPLLELADALPPSPGKKAFIFSTSGAPEALMGRAFIQGYAKKCHAALRGKLALKGFAVEGEFICAGHNTNAFLWRIGGLNKGRPNAADLGRAGLFARELGRLG
jgi:flavodoxin